MNTNVLDRIDSILKEYGTQDEPGPDEFTIYTVMESKGWSDNPANRRKALRLMDDMLASGLISMRKGRVRNREGNIYQFVDETATK